MFLLRVLCKDEFLHSLTALVEEEEGLSVAAI